MNSVFAKWQQVKDRYHELVPFPHSLTVMALAAKVYSSCVVPLQMAPLLQTCTLQPTLTLSCAILNTAPQTLSVVTTIFLAATSLSSLIHICSGKHLLEVRAIPTLPEARPHAD
jgi:hypothetical protein